MSPRAILILVVGLSAGLLALVVLVSSFSPRPVQAPRPPELGGQKVPDTVHEIRFDRRYDLFCSFFQEERSVYRGCKILGFTGRGEDSERGTAPTAVAFAGFSSMSSESGYSSGRHFDHWLVLELADGRKAYVPPGAVRYIEEALPGGK